MTHGQISPQQFLIREYQDIALRVRLIQHFDGNVPSCYRVEVRKGGESDGSIESEVYGLGVEQFNMALDCFKGHVLPMVNL